MDPATSTTVSKEHSKDNGGLTVVARNTPRPVTRELTEEMLARFASRAASYDRENRFFEEDFEELRASKYLLLPLPVEFGGAGLTLAEVCREQRRLAYHAPATALAVNMHLYWLGVAADLWRRGDTTLEWLLREAAAGEIFAAGHAESGNDIPVPALDIESRTCRGRLQVHGPKTFRQPDASLDAFWFAWNGYQRPQSAQDSPRVHATRYSWIHDQRTWDVLGMRATRSDDTVLEMRSFRTVMSRELCLLVERGSIRSLPRFLPGR